MVGRPSASLPPYATTLGGRSSCTVSAGVVRLGASAGWRYTCLEPCSFNREFRGVDLEDWEAQIRTAIGRVPGLDATIRRLGRSVPPAHRTRVGSLSSLDSPRCCLPKVMRAPKGQSTGTGWAYSISVQRLWNAERAVHNRPPEGGEFMYRVRLDGEVPRGGACPFYSTLQPQSSVFLSSPTDKTLSAAG